MLVSVKRELHEVIEFKGRMFITTHKLFEDLGSPFHQVGGLNRAIRGMETYETLKIEFHIVELSSDDHWGKAEHALLIKANSYKPVVLIDSVAQKAIEHHLKATALQAVDSAKENAFLASQDINIKFLDKGDIMALKAITKANEARHIAEENRERINDLEDSIDSRVTKSLRSQDINVWPEGCIKLDKLTTKYFKRMADEKVSRFLLHKGHPRKLHKYIVDDQEVREKFVYEEEGLRGMFEILVKESQHLTDTKVNHILRHPVVGRYYIKKKNW